MASKLLASPSSTRAIQVNPSVREESIADNADYLIQTPLLSTETAAFQNNVGTGVAQCSQDLNLGRK